VALDRGDSDAARAELALACEHLPRLSSDFSIVRPRVHNASRDRSQARAHFADLASLWPDPAAPTVRALRVSAAALALREGKVRTAARLVARRDVLLSRRALASLASELVRHGTYLALGPVRRIQVIAAARRARTGRP
jgi:hypothetical protein